MARTYRTTLYTVLLSAFFASSTATRVRTTRRRFADGRAHPASSRRSVGALANVALMRAHCRTSRETFADLLRQMHTESARCNRESGLSLGDSCERSYAPWLGVSEIVSLMFIQYQLTGPGWAALCSHLDPSLRSTTVTGLEIRRFDLDHAEEGD